MSRHAERRQREKQSDRVALRSLRAAVRGLSEAHRRIWEREKEKRRDNQN
jgi:hypothetical protein